MSGDELFSDFPQQANPRSSETGKARMREPVRDQVELRAVDLETLIRRDPGQWHMFQPLVAS